MLLNGNSYILVQHPRYMKEATQVKVKWFFQQYDKYPDDKWLIESLGGLVRFNGIHEVVDGKLDVFSIQTCHAELVDWHPYTRIVSYMKEAPLPISKIAETKGLVVRRRCVEDYALHAEMWESNRVIGASKRYVDTQKFYKIDGPDYLFVDSHLVANR